jgi:CRP/FNR family cyclic AMP-dependent transcriptional regulator
MDFHPPQRLHDRTLAALERCTQIRRYPKNTIIVSQGDRGETVFFILEGRVKVYVSDDAGDQVVVAMQARGEYFGELSLDDGLRSASVVTLVPTQLAVVPKAQFAALLAAEPELAVQLIGHLIGRVRSLTERVTDLALMDVYGRLVKLLHDQSTPRPDGARVMGRLTQQDLAELVGASREMVSRIFKELVAGGYVSLTADEIVVHKTPPRRW